MVISVYRLVDLPVISPVEIRERSAVLTCCRDRPLVFESDARLVITCPRFSGVPFQTAS